MVAPFTIFTVVGTRPNFVKAASLCIAMAKRREKLKNVLVHTGQHYDYKMSREFFELLRLPEPDIYLRAAGSTHAGQTADIMVKFEDVCLERKPDWVVVIGDVNSTLAATLAAKKLGIPVAHVEAGLRSYDMTMPEEINRRMVDAVCDLLFAPSEDACDNLRCEGAPESAIRLVGNVMIDTLMQQLPAVEAANGYKRWKLKAGRFVYVTLHRPSNVDEQESLARLLDALMALAQRIPVLFPMHPRTLSKLSGFGLESIIKKEKGLIITEPVSYLDSISLVKNSAIVLTDSGGLQEETTFLGIPCLTLRRNTERPVTITKGTNKLVNLEGLGEAVEEALRRGKQPMRPIPYWDGCASERIAEELAALV